MKKLTLIALITCCYSTLLYGQLTLPAYFDVLTYFSPSAVVACDDGGLLTSGMSHVFDTSIYIVKFDSNEMITWSRVFSSFPLDAFTNGSAFETNDHGFIIASYACYSQAILIMKLDSSGHFDWCKAYDYPIISLDILQVEYVNIKKMRGWFNRIGLNS